LQIFDIENPAGPKWVGGCDTPGHAWAIALSDNYAYVADGTSGLQIFDVTLPNRPVHVGSKTVSLAAYDVAVVGHLAYVADFGSKLHVVDISNPAGPQGAGECPLRGNAEAIAVSGGYAYVAEGNSGLEIIDIHQPSHPIKVGAWLLSGYEGRSRGWQVHYLGQWTRWVARSSTHLFQASVPSLHPTTNMATPRRLNIRQPGVCCVGSNGTYIFEFALEDAQPPAIEEHPTSVTVTAGEAAEFKVVGLGTTPLSFQWQFNGIALAGETNRTLLLPAVSLNNQATTR
jgi:hypothetical protein